MKLYIFEYVHCLTRRYHDSGGVVIITDRDPIQVLDEEINKNLDEYQEVLEPVVSENGIIVIDTEETEERVFIFEDSGCC